MISVTQTGYGNERGATISYPEWVLPKASKPLEGRDAVGGDEFCLRLGGSELTTCLYREMKILHEEQSLSLSLEASVQLKDGDGGYEEAFLNRA